MIKAHGGNLSSADAPGDDGRYARCDSQTPDLYTDGLNVEVSYMRKTARLLSHLDVRDAYESVPVVRVRRKADSTLEIDPTFIAPCLSVNAEPALYGLLRGLLGKLAAKAEALYRLQRQPRGHAIEAHSGDVSSFWMLYTVSSAGATLTHCANSGHCHPEQLFGKLIGVAGGLMAFSKKYTFADLPHYDHENPGPGFAALNAIIDELLDTVVSSKYITIPLVKDSNQRSCHHGKLDPTLIDGKASFYIAVSGDMPALNLVADVPRLFKIASPHDIEGLILSAMPGLQLIHMPQVPMEVPIRPSTYYFSIEDRGDCYEAAMKAQAITVYRLATIGTIKGRVVRNHGIDALLDVPSIFLSLRG